MPILRNEGRNVWLYLGDLENEIGGLILHHQHITKDEFYEIAIILVVANVPDELVGDLPPPFFSLYHLSNGAWQPILSDYSFLLPGKYQVRPAQPQVGLAVSNQLCIDCAISHSVTGCLESFKTAIRARDGGCVISGKRNPSAYKNNWTGRHAAHIWPLEHGSEWENEQIYRFIMDMPNADTNAKMNGIQNGMFLRVDVRDIFDKFLISVNPSRGYKVFAFGDDDEFAGRTLSPPAPQDGDSGVRDAPLTWHLRMCVLANMRGAGEPLWDYSYREEADVVGALFKEDPAGHRHALELNHRLVQQGFFV